MLVCFAQRERQGVLQRGIIGCLREFFAIIEYIRLRIFGKVLSNTHPHHLVF